MGAPTSGGTSPVFEDLFENSPIAYFVLDRGGFICGVNAAAERFIGFRRSELSGRHVMELYSDGPDGKPKANSVREQFLSGEAIAGVELEYRAADGGSVWGRLWVTPVLDENGRVAGSRSMVVDVTGERLARMAARRSDGRLRSALQAAPILMCFTDRNGICEFEDGRALELAGRRPGASIGHSVFETWSDQPQVVHHTRLALAGQTSSATTEIGPTTLQYHFVPERGADGEIVGAMFAAVDITDWIQAERELMRRVNYDQLTGLMFRPLFVRNIERAIDVARAKGDRVAVAILQPTNLRDIDETFGREFREEALRQITGQLRRAVGMEETALAHLFADYFGILFGSEVNVAALETQLRAIEGAFSVPLQVLGQPVVVNTNIGAAVFPDHADDADGLLRKARLALERAKQSGGGSQVFLIEDGNRHANAVHTHAELSRAVKDDQLAVYYQPMVSVKTLRLAILEALVRWPHPDRGLRSPEEFLPLAERSGLIRHITRQVLRRALDDQRRLKDAGICFRVSVNISEADFWDRDFAGEVRQILEEMRADPAMLCLEVSERISTKDLQAAAQYGGRLKEIGVGLAIDDFGAGRTSLALLRELPVDVLKIDRSFIGRLPTSKRDQAIVTSVLALATDLGVESVAEGIEDRACWDFVAAAGCHLAQGFYIARPMPREEVSRWLETWRGPVES